MSETEEISDDEGNEDSWNLGKIFEEPDKDGGEIYEKMDEKIERILN